MAMRAVGLSKSFEGRAVIRDFSHRFPERGVVALVGRSGEGKTTLIRLLLGLAQPDSGYVEGVGRTGAVFQEDRLIEHLTAVQNVALIGVEPSVALSHLAELGLSDAAHQPVAAFSGGMKRRVALARAVAWPSSATLLDEPFTGMDAETRAAAAAYVRRHCADRLVVVVSHDPEELRLLGATSQIELKGDAP
ncbi:MAG: ABC transporter ATP-binding protein [Clostridiales bacterium]|nr:ABC transporter ATP-binding protein [Clostridiales bacterium]